ncbi:MAG TPA: hypothetical protein VN515_10285 [Terriglobales bacterium]|nr:hypothetical protein [Terriglobales bacterium]
MVPKKRLASWILTGVWVVGLGLVAQSQVTDSLVAAAPSQTTYPLPKDPTQTLLSEPGSLDLRALDPAIQFGDHLSVCPASGEAWIVHLAVWTSPNSLAMSSWYLATGTGENKGKKDAGNFCGLKAAPLKLNGQPLLYGVPKVTLIGISVFKGNVTRPVVYQVSATPAQAQNQADLASLAQAAAGVILTAPRESAPVTNAIVVLVAETLPSASPRPYAINITYSAMPTGSRAKSAGASAQQGTSPASEGQAGAPTDCSNVSVDSPCTITRTFINEDKEWWGLSLAVPPLGYNVQSFTSADAAPSVGRQSGIYGMLDFYPGARWRPRQSWFPHAVVGLPLAGKPLQKAYFGIGENLTGYRWFANHVLNLPVSVTYGFVHYKEQRILGGTIASHWVWKDMFTLELPVSALVGLVKPGKL